MYTNSFQYHAIFFYKENRMSTRNFDSSLLTKRRQAKALGAFANQVATANANGTSLRVTQPNTQMAVIVTEQNLGKCYCSTDARDNPYEFNPSGGLCGCGYSR
jgi:hypothetical protein